MKSFKENLVNGKSIRNVYPHFTLAGKHLTLFYFFRISVCATCIVGEYIPVFRPGCNKWNFGRVKAASTSGAKPKFEVSFGITESEKEWLELESKPFDAYISSHHQKVAIVLGSLRQLPEPPVVANEPRRDVEDAPNSLKGHLYQRSQEPKPQESDSRFDVSLEECPHTPIQASVYRTLRFDSPMHSSQGSQFDNTTPVIGNGMNAMVSRTSANQLPTSRHWTIDVSSSRSRFVLFNIIPLTNFQPFLYSSSHRKTTR